MACFRRAVLGVTMFGLAVAAKLPNDTITPSPTFRENTLEKWLLPSARTLGTSTEYDAKISEKYHLNNQSRYLKQKEMQKKYAARTYYLKKKDTIKERCRNYYRDNKDKTKEYRLTKKDTIKERCRNYYRDNKDTINEHNLNYYRDNKNKSKEYRLKKNTRSMSTS